MCRLTPLQRCLVNRYRAAFGWSVLLVLLNGILLAQAPNTSTPTAKEHAEKQFRDVIEPVLKRDCFDCHSTKKATAGLDLQSLKPDFAAEASGELWQRVFERVRYREMPPTKPGEPGRPASAEASAEHSRFVEALSDALRLRPSNGWADLKPVEIRPDDSPALRLRKQLRNNAALQVGISREQYVAGRVTLGTVVESEQILAKAELGLATTPEERIATLKQALESARSTEDVVWVQVQAAIADQNKMLQAKQERLEAQLRLRLELDKIEQVKKK